MAQWVTVFSESLFGTSGAHCRIQKRGQKYRVTSGQKTWSYHDTAGGACEACARYCAQYNHRKGLVADACPFEALGISK